MKVAILFHSSRAANVSRGRGSNQVLTCSQLATLIANTFEKNSHQIFVFPDSVSSSLASSSARGLHVLSEIYQHFQLDESNLSHQAILLDDMQGVKIRAYNLTSFHLDSSVGFHLTHIYELLYQYYLTHPRNMNQSALTMSMIPYSNEEWIRANHLSSSSLNYSIDVICPNMISDSLLAQLPPILLTAGENELFYHDIDQFAHRLLRLNQQRRDSTTVAGATRQEHVYVSAPDEVHAHPMFYIHPRYALMSNVGLGWLFLYFFPSFAEISHHCQVNDDYVSSADKVLFHSKEAFDAILAMAKFISERK